MRRVAVACLVLVGVTAVWLTAQSVLAGRTYGDDPRNARALPDANDRRLGIITTTDGILLAEDDGSLRSYPQGADYLHLVGLDDPGASFGVETTRSLDLRSLDDGSITAWLVDLFGGSLDPPEVRLTVLDRLQQVATDELSGRTGAIVALDPTTGAVLAYASSPSADPNDVMIGALDATDLSTGEVGLDRVARRLLPPGSIFKVLVALAAVEAGATADTLYPDTAEYLAPGADVPITNVTGGRCAGSSEISLRDALATSCNTVFAPLALELGGDTITEIAERAGFNAPFSFELGALESSLPAGPDLDADPGALAQTGLGERDVRATVLQMAVVVAALGNDGQAMRPYVVERVVSRDGTTIETTSPTATARITDAASAATVVEMMEAVTTDGTGRAAAVPGITVAGKTGTAEGSGGPHSWFIALAPAEDPEIALAILIEGEGTGGTTAAPIAASLLNAFFSG